MKIKSLYIFILLLIMGLSACNKEEVLNLESIPANAVQITASVGNLFVATRSNPVGDATEQAKFNIGDRMLVMTHFSNKVVYEFNGSKWAPIGKKYLLWTDSMSDFYADYPVKGADECMFNVQQDQSTLQQLALSDLMTSEIKDAPKSTILNFTMERKTSRIIIKIAKFNPEFSLDSKVTNVMIEARCTVGSELFDKYKPYSPDGVDGSIGSTYTLLSNDFTPGHHKRVSLKVGDKIMLSSFLPTMEKGKSYTFNLVVGKEMLEIESVTVEDWTNTVSIPGGQAQELT